MTSVAEQLVESCEHDPPQDVDGHPKLFSDLDDDELPRILFELWRKGLLDAEYDEDAEETLWQLTAFGMELCERGLVEIYCRAVDQDVEIEVGPSDLVDPRGSV